MEHRIFAVLKGQAEKGAGRVSAKGAKGEIKEPKITGSVIHDDEQHLCYMDDAAPRTRPRTGPSGGSS